MYNPKLLASVAAFCDSNNAAISILSGLVCFAGYPNGTDAIVGRPAIVATGANLPRASVLDVEAPSPSHTQPEENAGHPLAPLAPESVVVVVSVVESWDVQSPSAGSLMPPAALSVGVKEFCAIYPLFDGGSANAKCSMYVTDAGGRNVLSLVMTRRSRCESEPRSISLDCRTIYNLSSMTSSPHLIKSLSEPGFTWRARSTHESTSGHRTAAPRPCVSRIFLPSNTVLTPRILLAAYEKLSTPEVEDAIEKLIAILNRRSGDPDLEADVDYEVEVGEDSEVAICAQG